MLPLVGIVSPRKTIKNGKIIKELITTEIRRDLINIDIIKSEIGIRIRAFNNEKYNIKVIPIKQSNNPI